MAPVLTHLIKKFPALQVLDDRVEVNSDLQKVVSQLGPEVYGELIGFHPHLNMEYSILCQKIRHDLTYADAKNKEQLIQNVKDALKYAEMLEYLNLHYLIVPREVRRLRNHKKIYRDLLTDLAGITFQPQGNVLEVDVGLSLSQLIREDTGLANWYRILLSRSKRVLNALAVLELSSEKYIEFMVQVDLYMNPFLAYLAWCFFVPRLFTNLFLLLKHTIPNAWMDEHERSLVWTTRFIAHLQRRWFELANDSVWFAVGLLNCFILIGPLAPIGAYLSIAAFMFDVSNVAFRAYIELRRLNGLKQEYLVLLGEASDETSKQQILDHLHHIEQRIQFERMRSGLAISGAVAVVLAMSLAVPALATLGPALPLVAAILLILIWVAMYILTQQLEKYRPKDAIEKPEPSALRKLGLFASKDTANREVAKTPANDELVGEEIELTTLCRV